MDIIYPIHRSCTINVLKKVWKKRKVLQRCSKIRNAPGVMHVFGCNARKKHKRGRQRGNYYDQCCQVWAAEMTDISHICPQWCRQTETDTNRHWPPTTLMLPPQEQGRKQQILSVLSQPTCLCSLNGRKVSDKMVSHRDSWRWCGSPEIQCKHLPTYFFLYS